MQVKQKNPWIIPRPFITTQDGNIYKNIQLYIHKYQHKLQFIGNLNQMLKTGKYVKLLKVISKKTLSDFRHR